MWCCSVTTLPGRVCFHFCLSRRWFPKMSCALQNAACVLPPAGLLCSRPTSASSQPRAHVSKKSCNSALVPWSILVAASRSAVLLHQFVLPLLIFLEALLPRCVPFCDNYSCLMEKSLSPLSISTPFLSSSVQSVLSPVVVPGFQLAFSFQPFDQDELFRALFFQSRDIFVLLLLLLEQRRSEWRSPAHSAS